MTVYVSGARLVEILREHRLDDGACDCGVRFEAGLTDDELHDAMAEHVAAKITGGGK